MPKPRFKGNPKPLNHGGSRMGAGAPTKICSGAGDLCGFKNLPTSEKNAKYAEYRKYEYSRNL